MQQNRCAFKSGILHIQLAKLQSAPNNNKTGSLAASNEMSVHAAVVDGILALQEE